MTLFRYYVPVALCACVAALALAGCPSGKPQHNPPDTVAAARYPGPWSLTLSSGGGFTGIYAGYTVYSDGRVQFWRKHMDSVQTTGTISGDMVEYIYHQLQAIGFRLITLNTPTDLNFRLELREGDSTHLVQWGGDAKDVPDAPKALYTALNNFMRSRFGTR